MKTNVDLISPQENALLNKSKENQKNIKEEKNKSINSPKNSKFENNEKNKEDENKNDNKENNENIILEKVNNEKNDNIKNEDNINDIIKNVLEEKKEVDPLLSYINSNRKISEEEIKNGPKLILEEIDGNLFNGKKIEINAGGMVEGRNKKE